MDILLILATLQYKSCSDIQFCFVLSLCLLYHKYNPCRLSLPLAFLILGCLGSKLARILYPLKKNVIWNFHVLPAFFIVEYFKLTIWITGWVTQSQLLILFNREFFWVFFNTIKRSWIDQIGKSYEICKSFYPEVGIHIYMISLMGLLI